MLAGVVTPPDQPTLELLGPLHDPTGILGGFGYAALLCLLALPLQARRRVVVDAIAAVGSGRCPATWPSRWLGRRLHAVRTRSPDKLTVTTTALLAVATWLITVVLADWMRRTGRRGPIEVLVRRVTYQAKPS